MLDMRKLALATGALLGLGLSQTFAVNPVLVKVLEQKGILTEEETQKVLSAGERGDIVLAEILKEKGILTEEETQKVIATAPKKTAKPTEEFSKSELKRLKNLAGLKIGGVAYLHYDYTLHGTKKSKDDSNEFKVTRAYLEIRKYFDKNNNSRYFRLTLDVFKDEPKDGYQARLKYAYLNWDITPYLQTEIGLAHRPAIDWIEHHLWKHRYMEKTFYEDKAGAHLMNSADLGIAVKGKIQGFGYMFGIYNGEGYHVAENDHHFGKSIEGRVNYTFPFGLTLAMDAAYIDNDNTNSTKATDKYIVHPMVVYENKYFLLGAQYIYDREKDYHITATQTEDYTHTGWAVNGDLKFKGFTGIPATLFARYGQWNYDNDYTKGNDRNELIAGAEYDFNKYIKAGLSYKRVDYDKKAGDRDYEDTLMAAMQIKW
jgi:hypothetical protein